MLFAQTPTRDLLIIGGDARLAQRLARLTPALRVVRRAGAGPSFVAVDNYAALPEAIFAGVRTVVNCVGISTGDPDTLNRVNVEVAERAAKQARSAGCRHYIVIGSLSVHGHASRIDNTTPIAPVSDYGRSKAAAEAAVAAFATPGFAVTIMRAPALYGADAQGKFGMLARLMCVARAFPVPRDLRQRSVLHLGNAAVVVAKLAANADPKGGTLFAADHEPFDLYRFAAALRTARGEHVRLLRAPDAVFALLRAVAPGVHASLFAASLIDADAAITTKMDLPISLDVGLAEMLAVGLHPR